MQPICQPREAATWRTAKRSTASTSLARTAIGTGPAQEVDIQQVGKVSFGHIFREVLEDLIPLAQAKHIDVGSLGMLTSASWRQKLI